MISTCWKFVNVGSEEKSTEIASPTFAAPFAYERLLFLSYAEIRVNEIFSLKTTLSTHIFSFALNASEVEIVLSVKVKKTRYTAHGTRFFRKIIPPIPLDPSSFEGQTTNSDLIATKIFAARQTVYLVILYIISQALGSWQQSGPWIILDGSMVARAVPPISDSRIYFGIASFVSPFRPQFLINRQFFHASRYEYYINNRTLACAYTHNTSFRIDEIVSTICAEINSFRKVF